LRNVISDLMLYQKHSRTSTKVELNVIFVPNGSRRIGSRFEFNLMLYQKHTRTSTKVELNVTCVPDGSRRVGSRSKFRMIGS
jgi:hypothetical protein